MEKGKTKPKPSSEFCVRLRDMRERIQAEIPSAGNSGYLLGVYWTLDKARLARIEQAALDCVKKGITTPQSLDEFGTIMRPYGKQPKLRIWSGPEPSWRSGDGTAGAGEIMATARYGIERSLDAKCSRMAGIQGYHRRVLTISDRYAAAYPDEMKELTAHVLLANPEWSQVFDAIFLISMEIQSNGGARPIAHLLATPTGWSTFPL